MRFGKNTEKKMMHAAWKAQWMLRKPNQLADRSELDFSALGGDRDAGGGQEALLSRKLMWTSCGSICRVAHSPATQDLFGEDSAETSFN